MSHDDECLLRRAREGDERAFDSLVARHGALVLSLARKVLGARQDADDVAQEVFLRLYRNLSRLDTGRPLEPWLARVTLNAARNHGARNPGRREDSLESSGSERAVEPAALEQLQQREIALTLREASESLPARQREVFVLRDLQGLDSALVAEALGISDVTVRRLSSEARKRVSDWIRQHRPELMRGT